MNRSKETSTTTDGSFDIQKECSGSTDSIEIELDTPQLRALNPAASTAERSLDEVGSSARDFIDTATNLELSQSVEDLTNLSWPGLTPGSGKKLEK